MSPTPDTLFGLFICLLILLFNFCFVILETSIIASTKSRLHTYLRESEKRVKKVMQLIDSPEELLSTMQVGLTLANILLGLLSSTYFEWPIISLLSQINIFQTLLGEYIGIVSKICALLFVTFLTVLFEILSKRIAILFPERIAINTVYFVVFFIWMFYPIVWLLTISVRFLLRLLRIKNIQPLMSVEEVKFIINQTQKSGVIDKLESDMMRRLVHIGRMQVGAIITPRNKIVVLDIALPLEVNLQRLNEHKYNYYPLIDGNYTNLVGVVYVKNLVGLSEITNEILIKEAKSSPIHYIPQMAHVSSLLYAFKNKGIKFGIALDEYGGFEGIVTFSDIIRTFAGDIAALVNKRSPDIIEVKENYYLLLGNTLIEEVIELMKVTSLPGYEEHEYKTIASFILRYIANVPSVGNEFIVDDWKFKIIAMDGMCIEKISLEKVESD